MFSTARTPTALTLRSALPSRNIGIRAISTSKPTALASAGGVTSVGQDTGLIDRPARREVLLPSQEKPKNVVDYALCAPLPHPPARGRGHDHDPPAMAS